MPPSPKSETSLDDRTTSRARNSTASFKAFSANSAVESPWIIAYGSTGGSGNTALHSTMFASATLGTWRTAEAKR